jgi:hypothetical protein
LSQLEQINIIENVLMRLIKCERYFELCTGHKGHFWPIVQNSVGESACLFWCHIFGNREDNVHYSQFFKNEKRAGFTIKEVKSRMLKAIDLDEGEYFKFWVSVKDCRDKFVSHKELRASVIFPEINKCRLQAEELRRILAEYATLVDSEAPESGWNIWVEYYGGQWLLNHQFETECSREFERGITSLAHELTSKTE